MHEDSVAAAKYLLVDSVTDLRSDTAAGALVVSGSHGGVFAARFAAHRRVGGIVFNDAGLGRQSSGIAGLSVIDDFGIPAAAVSHECAEIGNAQESLAADVR